MLRIRLPIRQNNQRFQPQYSVAHQKLSNVNAGEDSRKTKQTRKHEERQQNETDDHE